MADRQVRYNLLELSLKRRELREGPEDKLGKALEGERFPRSDDRLGCGDLYQERGLGCAIVILHGGSFTPVFGQVAMLGPFTNAPRGAAGCHRGLMDS